MLLIKKFCTITFYAPKNVFRINLQQNNLLFNYLKKNNNNNHLPA